MSLDDSLFESQSSLLASNTGDASQDPADMEHISADFSAEAGRVAPPGGGTPVKRSGSDVNDAVEEPEEKDDVQGLGFPTARVQRIMRKHPDKKKRFVKEAVHAVAIATVSRTFFAIKFF